MTYVTRYGIEDRFFDDQLSLSAPARAEAVSFFGGPITDVDIVMLSGAPAHSDITCETVRYPYDARNDRQRDALSIKVRHPIWISRGWANEVVVFINDRDEYELYIELVMLEDDAPTGLATLMLWRMVRACEALGIPRISLSAIGGRSSPGMDNGRRWGGYYFWPAVGFDGAISDQCREFFQVHYRYHPKDVGLIHQVRDLLALEDGPAFWKVSGDGLRNCEFRVGETEASVGILRGRVERLVGV